MNVTFTARRFKAHDEIKERAMTLVRKLDRFYDGIVRADIILSYERAANSVKTAEVNLHVHGGVLSAREKSDDFQKSIDIACEKLTMRLRKYKSRLQSKDKAKVRSLKRKV